jgi:hypothetical protein
LRSVVHTKYKQLFEVDINEYIDILKQGGSPDSDLDFLLPSGQSGKGVGGAIVCALNHCNIAKRSRVAK